MNLSNARWMATAFLSSTSATALRTASTVTMKTPSCALQVYHYLTFDPLFVVGLVAILTYKTNRQLKKNVILTFKRVLLFSYKFLYPSVKNLFQLKDLP